MEESLGIQAPNCKLENTERCCRCMSIFYRDLNRSIERSLIASKSMFLCSVVPGE